MSTPVTGQSVTKSVRGYWRPVISAKVPTVRPVACHYCHVKMPQGTRFATVAIPRGAGQLFNPNVPCCEACVWSRAFERNPYVVDGVEVPL